MKRRKFIAVLPILIILAVVGACSRNNGSDENETELAAAVFPTAPAVVVTPRPTAAPTPTPTPVPTPTPTPAALNPLTGLPLLNEASLLNRPYAIVFGNAQASLPQSGLASADIVYEVLSEGNITRIIGIYKELTATRLGSIRSMRDYFLHFALDHDAIFVHHGQSSTGGAALRTWGVNNINGIAYDGTTFWRDPHRWSIGRLREHSSFTSAENLIARADNLRLRTASESAPVFSFREEPAALAGGEATRIIITYAQGFRPVFEYDPETQTYARFQFGAAHIDDLTGEQLTVTNVIVQIARSWINPNDSLGVRQFELVGSGTGWLFSNGTYEPITWEKESRNSPTVWMDENGEPLLLNPGRTWVNVVSTQPIFE